jgi:Rieske Fe-S protein
MNDLDNTAAKISRRSILEYWWTLPVAVTAGFFGWFGMRSYGILFGKPQVTAPNFRSGRKAAVAQLQDFSTIWTARPFKFQQTVGASIVQTPCILVRTRSAQVGGLSVGNKHFLGLSRICTHLQCTCEYITNSEVASFAYKYRPEFAHPVLGCACHYSAFDPELAGRSVSGPAIKPLPRVQLEHQNGVIYAVGLESD